MPMNKRFAAVVAALCLSRLAAALPEDTGTLSAESWDAGGLALSSGDTPTTVYYPAAATGPFPVVAVVHGASRNGGYHVTLAQTLASRGFVALVPSMDCSFLGCDHAVQATGVLELFDWAVAESADPDSPILGLVDGARRGVIGHSWGGLAVFLAAAGEPAVDAVVCLDPNDDDGVALAAAPTVVAPTLILRADNSGACNSLWTGAVYGAVAGAKMTATIIGSGHCDPEDPTDFLCPLACGSGDAATTPIFRRYAVAFMACALGVDPAMAEWAGGASYDADVAGGILIDGAVDGIVCALGARP